MSSCAPEAVRVVDDCSDVDAATKPELYTALFAGGKELCGCLLMCLSV